MKQCVFPLMNLIFFDLSWLLAVSSSFLFLLLVFLKSLYSFPTGQITFQLVQNRRLTPPSTPDSIILLYRISLTLFSSESTLMNQTLFHLITIIPSTLALTLILFQEPLSYVKILPSQECCNFRLWPLHSL